MSQFITKQEVVQDVKATGALVQTQAQETIIRAVKEALDRARIASTIDGDGAVRVRQEVAIKRDTWRQAGGAKYMNRLKRELEEAGWTVQVQDQLPRQSLVQIEVGVIIEIS